MSILGARLGSVLGGFAGSKLGAFGGGVNFTPFYVLWRSVSGAAYHLTAVDRSTGQLGWSVNLTDMYTADGTVSYSLRMVSGIHSNQYLVEDSAGNCIAYIFVFGSPGAAYLVKFSREDGSVIWSTAVDVGNQNIQLRYDYSTDVVFINNLSWDEDGNELHDGSATHYIGAGIGVWTGNYAWVPSSTEVRKFNPDGTLNTTFALGKSSSYSYVDVHDVAYDGGYIYITGRLRDSASNIRSVIWNFAESITGSSTPVPINQPTAYTAMFISASRTTANQWRRIYTNQDRIAPGATADLSWAAGEFGSVSGNYSRRIAAFCLRSDNRLYVGLEGASGATYNITQIDTANFVDRDDLPSYGSAPPLWTAQLGDDVDSVYAISHD